MGKRVGLLAGLLALALGTGAVAQEPSPEPPPWLGGRVEMPEHGFAVSLPDDWVGFDTTADAVAQREAASDFLDPLLWLATSDAEWVEELASAAPEGFQLLSGHAMSSSTCWLGAWRTDRPLADAVDTVFEWYEDDPDTRDLKPPQSIDLPAGPAYRIRMTRRVEPGVEWWLPSSLYVLGADGVEANAYCNTSDARPKDDWLSIVETIELLPAEPPQPPPWLGGRVEMPEHGFAVTLPDDWVALDTSADGASQLEVAIDAFAPGQWSTDESAWLAGLAKVASNGFPLWAGSTTSSSRCELGRSHDMSLGEAAVDHLQWYLDDPDTRDVEPRLVELPTGTAYRIRMSYWDGPDSDEWRPASSYLLDAGGFVLEAYCKANDARPNDDWLAIIETIEFWPVED